MMNNQPATMTAQGQRMPVRTRISRALQRIAFAFAQSGAAVACFYGAGAEHLSMLHEQDKSQ